MNGFYSLWSKPYFQDKNHKEYYLQDYELLTLILSAACYQRHNGSVRMYGDEAALEYLETVGLADFFQNGLCLMKVPESLDAGIFWAAGKLCALKLEQAPSVMLDTDLIVWRNLDGWLKQKQIAVIHREELREEIYPDPSSFQVAEGYHFPKDWDFSVMPANTALLFIRDEGFKQTYVEESMRFMLAMGETTDNLCPMVFAEQRILPMCAARAALTVSAYCGRLEELREQDMFTHVWGHKNVLRFNQDENWAYCRRIMGRLKRDFPEGYETAAGIEQLKEYLC